MEGNSVRLNEVGPREGLQFEGIGRPDAISTTDKVRLVEGLVATGVKQVQVTSFVNPKAVPQMADAEELSRRLPVPPEGVEYTAVILNDKGLERAAATGRYCLDGFITFTASEEFSMRNQRRSHKDDVEMQRRLVEMFLGYGSSVERGIVVAAFGCNYEGDIPLTRVLSLIEEMHGLAGEYDCRLTELQLADTMGWADPEMIKRTIGAIRDRWPDLELELHLHDTRGTGMANVYAGLEMGVRRFDTSVGGLGGCPFAGTVAGNVPTEDVVFMAERMGFDTGIDLARMVECAKLAEEIVGHSLPSRLSAAGVGTNA
jgi:hydroxymethylglutaryl-CoA lyase